MRKVSPGQSQGNRLAESEDKKPHSTRFKPLDFRPCRTTAQAMSEFQSLGCIVCTQVGFFTLEPCSRTTLSPSHHVPPVADEAGPSSGSRRLEGLDASDVIIGRRLELIAGHEQVMHQDEFG